MHYIIPADPQNGQPKDKRIDYIGTVNAVQVPELENWLRMNPDVTAKQLADMLAEGAFA